MQNGEEKAGALLHSLLAITIYFVLIICTRISMFAHVYVFGVYVFDLISMQCDRRKTKNLKSNLVFAMGFDC